MPLYLIIGAVIGAAVGGTIGYFSSRTKKAGSHCNTTEAPS